MSRRKRIAGLRVWIVPLFVLVTIAVWFVVNRIGRRPEGVALRFCGAAREVGGSCLLVETGAVRFIVDCGALGDAGCGVLPEEPGTLSFTILTHAHLDHCGLLPELYAAGFRGPVYCSRPTAAIVPVMLRMSRGLSREKAPKADFDRSLAGLVALPFDSTVTACGVSFRLRRAGHLLGAAFIEFEIPAENGAVQMVVSGDIGGGNSLLLPCLEKPGIGGYVVMESTYGGIVREGMDSDPVERHRPFAEAVGGALRQGGDVLVPAFALGRTQEVLAVIDCYRDRGVIPGECEVYADSPSAGRISRIYRSFPGELSRWAREFYTAGIIRSPALREVRSKMSLAVHKRDHRPAIFVSSSGDLEFANSPRHLMQLYDDPGNLLCFVGWLSPGSLGKRLAAGESPVLVRYREGKGYKRDWITPEIGVRRFHSFSSHADQRGLLAWLGGMPHLSRVFLVHGEPDQAFALGKAIRERYGVEVEIPERGERFVLEPNSDGMRTGTGMGGGSFRPNAADPAQALQDAASGG